MHSIINLPPPYVAQALELTRQLQAHQSYAPNLSRALQLEQLRRLVGHAAEYSPFWKQRLSAADISATTLGWQHFSELPPLQRTEIQSCFEQLKAIWPGRTDNHCDLVSTSGSTGIPLRYERYLPVYRPLYHAIAQLDDLCHQRQSRAKVCVIGVGVKDGERSAWSPMHAYQGNRGTVGIRAISDRPDHSHLDWLVEQQPDYLKASPHLAASLAELALASGVELALKQVISQSERVTPRHRELVAKAFGARITDRYSCEEAGWIALQCPRHDHLHVVNPAVIVEIVDDRLQPCGPGEVGRVLITALHSYSMPLIRYDLGDLAQWGEPCDCGNRQPVLKRIWGRDRHQFTTARGDRVPMPFLGDDIAKLPSIRAFQIRQYRDRAVEILIESSPGVILDDATRAALKRIMEDNGLSSLPLYIKPVESIDWGTGVKREEFICLDTPYSSSEVVS